MARTRYDVIFLGRKIGTATDITIEEDLWIVTDFKPLKGVRLPAAASGGFHLKDGLFRTYNEDGDVLSKDDFVSPLASVKPVR